MFFVKTKLSVILTQYFNVEGYTLNNLISLLKALFFKIIEVAFLFHSIISRLKYVLRMPDLALGKL